MENTESPEPGNAAPAARGMELFGVNGVKLDMWEVGGDGAGMVHKEDDLDGEAVPHGVNGWGVEWAVEHT